MTAVRSPLTPDCVRSVLDYCPETGVITWKASGVEAGYVAPDGHRRIKVMQFKTTAGRIAWAHYYGVMPSRRLRNLNGDPLDVRIRNLREARPSARALAPAKPRNTSFVGFGFESMRQAVLVLSENMPCADVERLLNVSRSTVYNYRWEEKYPEKRLAHREVEYALRWGELTKQPCAHCGAEDVQAHHEYYSRPLDVIWLCAGCHNREHNQ